MGAGGARKPCSDLVKIGCNFPICVVLVVSVFMAAFNERDTGWLDKVKDTAMTWVILALGFFFQRVLLLFFILVSTGVGVKVLDAVEPGGKKSGREMVQMK